MKGKEDLAQEYADLKFKQSIGGFTEEHLFIMRFAFMAGYDAGKRATINADTSVVPNGAHIEPYKPDHKGERVVSWYFMEKRTKPNNHLHFKWQCSFCGSKKNELNTNHPNGYAEVTCDNCDEFMYLEKILQSTEQ